MYVFGYHPVREALRHRPHRVRRVLVARQRGGSRRREIEEECRRHGVDCAVVPARRLDELAPGAVHNGFAAELPVGAERAAAAGDPDLVVLVEDVQDPRNLGALLRVCEGAGVGKVLIRDRGAAPISAAAAKTSAGAIEWLDIERIPNSAAALDRLKQQGFWAYGAVAGAEPAWAVDLTGRVVLCLGGEERGLRARTRAVCDRLVGVPMKGRVESLNVSTAAAALLYEALRQRGG